MSNINNQINRILICITIDPFKSNDPITTTSFVIYDHLRYARLHEIFLLDLEVVKFYFNPNERVNSFKSDNLKISHTNTLLVGPSTDWSESNLILQPISTKTDQAQP